MKTILVTGGAGFIGSNLIRFLVNKYKNYKVINFDLLTYAGNLENLTDIKSKKNYLFIKGNISKNNDLKKVFNSYKIDIVINLAAESHVDRSILNPLSFVKTNVLGTVKLLEMVKNNWQKDYSDKLFYHISTDEVFGSLLSKGFFNENSKYEPNSPYSASKASSDHFVRSYLKTYNIPSIISNCSNNYGPYQFPEKLIPLVINNILKNIEIPIYGNGENIRDWLYVDDHIRAIDLIINKGKIGENYLIGGFNELKNIDLVNKIIETTDKLLGEKPGSSKSLISFVKDRPGHDVRYAIDSSKIISDLGWKPMIKFEDGILKTVKWYLENKKWVELVTRK
ncbi:MAG: dTDP-glucose 4,6-dehydratase [Flavobacteriaceae bacterium]